jgi:Arc/MetJ-type ribon-helix-helix transcriptional regulator
MINSGIYILAFISNRMPSRSLILISVNISKKLLSIIDDLVAQGIYSDRSEAIRSLLIRGLNDYLREHVQKEA